MSGVPASMPLSREIGLDNFFRIVSEPSSGCGTRTVPGGGGFGAGGGGSASQGGEGFFPATTFTLMGAKRTLT